MQNPLIVRNSNSRRVANSSPAFFVRTAARILATHQQKERERERNSECAKTHPLHTQRCSVAIEGTVDMLLLGFQTITIPINFASINVIICCIYIFLLLEYSHLRGILSISIWIPYDIRRISEDICDGFHQIYFGIYPRMYKSGTKSLLLEHSIRNNNSFTINRDSERFLQRWNPNPETCINLSFSTIHEHLLGDF